MPIQNAVPRRKSALTFAASLILAMACSQTEALATDLDDCKIDTVAGQVSATSQGESRAVAPGLSIGSADTLTTGPDGRVRIVCRAETSFVVGSATQIVFEKLARATKSESFTARIIDGIAGFIVQMTGGERFEVHTPSAVASVRSTEWTVEVIEGGTAVFVRKGAVAVHGKRAPDVKVLLRRGEGVDVTAQGRLGSVKSWGQKRIDRMNGRLGFDWK
ncbi:MAG: FecR family protein [Pseudomonadota bacterium]